MQNVKPDERSTVSDGLELEITESLIMEDIKHNIASLHAIRAMGVTIASLLNCDEMQGFLFSKPVPVGIFQTRFLAPPDAGRPGNEPSS